MFARMLLARNIKSNKSEGIDEGLAAFINRKYADSEEGAKDPNNANNHPACPIVAKVNSQSMERFLMVSWGSDLPVKNFLLKMYPLPYIAASLRLAVYSNFLGTD